MPNTNPVTTPAPSIAAHEAEFFGKLAGDWWNPAGSSAMLHRITPLRSALVRDTVTAHFGREARARRPLKGLSALDIGCGAGLMTEPLARMGAAATGIDAAPENIAAAADHARAGGLAIGPTADGGGSVVYHATSVEAFAATGARYDIITCFEVVEHVADRDSFFAGVAALLAPGGIAILSTPNRTAASWAVIIAGAEWITRRIPRGAHDWNRFMTPDELSEALVNAGLAVSTTHGLGWSPASGFRLGSDTSINYFLVATHP